jgi:sortase A
MTLLRWSRRALFCIGVALLGYCVFVLVDARRFQARENQVLDRLLDEKVAKLDLASPSPSIEIPVAVTAGGLIGRIEIPRLGLSEVVMEGSDASTLRRAVGHVPGTPLPGQEGNTAITGHRDTFFRPLRKIRPDDLIKLTTLQGEFLYRVVSTGIVDPGDVEVLDSTGRQELTLVTCYPFYFVGTAPHRFIVRAERVTAT